MLREYQQRFAMGARSPKREEWIGSQRQRSDEAPWALTAAEESDLELALRAAPLRWVLLAFMDLAIGESDWRSMFTRRPRRTAPLGPCRTGRCGGRAVRAGYCRACQAHEVLYGLYAQVSPD